MFLKRNCLTIFFLFSSRFRAKNGSVFNFSGRKLDPSGDISYLISFSYSNNKYQKYTGTHNIFFIYFNFKFYQNWIVERLYNILSSTTL